jgi:hypothetical protein
MDPVTPEQACEQVVVTLAIKDLYKLLIRLLVSTIAAADCLRDSLPSDGHVLTLDFENRPIVVLSGGGHGGGGRREIAHTHAMIRIFL